MKRISYISIACAMLSVFAMTVSAQPARILGGHMLQLDDGSGNTITIQTPNGGWLGNINYMLPQPPYPAGPSGWIAPGTLDGQIPVWNVLLNSWQPQLPSLALNVASNAEPFLTFAPAGALTNNRILNAGSGINLVSSGVVPNASFMINNTGVLSAIAGGGISISNSTGDVTITNTGVGQVLGTPNQVIVNNIGAIGQPGVIVLSTPQDIATNSSPTFAGLTITGLTPAGIVHNTVGGLLSSSAVNLASPDVTGILSVPNGGTGISSTPTNGQLLIGNSSGYTLSTLTGTIDEINVANASGSITLSTPQPIAATSSPTFSGLSLSGKGTSASTVAGDVGATLVTKDFVTTPGNVAVMTNTSLIGDGTIVTPLGFNLNNSNSWTAAQLLPNSAAQGDNLIASTNAGTTTINAVRIGNGLTDAQVNDNLTINGGSITNSPIENSTIGAVTPNTGAFTTLNANNLVTFSALPNASAATDIVMSNAGGLETRTIASLGGMIAINTDATLTGNGTIATPLGFNLSNSNAWTADQLLPNSAAQGNNLIAATNAGVTTVNAVRIGNGLTDAQVNDNLTINGGSVTNSPIENSTIGAITPNTGAFTTLNANNSVTFSALPNVSVATDIVMSNAGSLETRTIASLGGMIGVNTDATLTGNGTVATPLGFNLNNSNTWTADQLLPNSAVQGDNLIAATNAGTTTVNAVRIGNGLTDAQVNDNLTINGGSVTNSPIENSTIGAVTPNTGAFTTLNANNLVTFSALPNASAATDIVMSNGGSLETRTIASLGGMIGVNTNATLTGNGTVGTPLGFNFSNSNTWTADQLLPNSSAQGDNLISAVNASASTINAVNIGNGLTDAQVNDNLTINGGTINNSPVGAVTPNIGAFTTLNANNAVTFSALPNASAATDIVMSNAGGLETRTIASLNNAITVATNSSLIGDGTAGNPLGINLSNANTWSATQNLQATDAQGSNLIASVNSSLAGVINANRISNGLTDAQVNDNLTINGGTINNSPVGAVTPNTGAFTTLGANSNVTFSALPNASAATDIVMSNAGGLETRTIASLNNAITVATNSSLIGDGTVGNPLGFSLDHSNTWTADQLLPNSTAQGDNLISSVNAGSTTINTNMIGNGLTDAQVNDNLTINGGTIDNTPVGSVTPNTGAFTTLGANSTVTFSALPNASAATDIIVSNGGSLETRTIASLGSAIAVNTDATLTGNGTAGNPLGFNLSNANTWSATQNLQATDAQGSNLIASVNSSAAGVINANRIGNGLTDAQVNDNLTINGGTINNSPVGAVTASTGRFTTISATALPSSSASTEFTMSNAGALETRSLNSFGDLLWQIGGNSISGPSSMGSTSAQDVIFIRSSNEIMRLTSPGAVDELLVSAPTNINAVNSIVGNGTDVTMLTVKGMDLGIATGNHLLVEGNAKITQKLTVNGTISASSIDATPIGGGVRSTGNFTSLDANNGLTVSNNKEITLTGAVNNKYATDALAAAYTLGSQDYILVCTNAAAGNVNLPANPPAGRTYIIKSMGAGNVNVVPANVLITIDGVAGNYVIGGGLKAYLMLVCDGTNWFVVNK